MLCSARRAELEMATCPAGEDLHPDLVLAELGPLPEKEMGRTAAATGPELVDAERLDHPPAPETFVVRAPGGGQGPRLAAVPRPAIAEIGHAPTPSLI